MKKIFSLIIILMLGTLIFSADKLGYINSKTIFSSYKGIADINKEIEKELTAWKKQMTDMQNEISELERTYKDQEAMLSEEAKLRKQQEINTKRESLNRFIEEIWGENGKSVNINKQMLKPVVDKINSIIKKIGDEEGYSIIVDFADGSILYAKKEGDLTERVLNELNKEFFIPVAGILKYIVFDFAALDKETRNEQYHIKLAKALYTNLKVTNKLEPINIKDVNELLKSRGLTNIEDLKPSDAINYGLELSADYAITGAIKMSGSKIIIEVHLYSIKERTEIRKIEKEAMNDIEFSQVLSEIVSEINTYTEK